MTNKNVSNGNILNGVCPTYDGVLALAFACIGQDAGIPGKSYIRIFPTSVEQCFNAIRGRKLQSDDPDLEYAQSGKASFNLARMLKKHRKANEDNDDNSTSSIYCDENDGKEPIIGKAMFGEIACLDRRKAIRDFVSTMLPVEVVDALYGDMRADAERLRQDEIEARAFAQRLDASAKTQAEAKRAKAGDYVVVDGQISLLA